MKNWVIQGLLYDVNPSSYNYIKSRWYHYHFCKKDDSTINAALYLDNLAGEINNEISKQKAVNKKSLALSTIKKILENKKAKQELVELFEKKRVGINDEIKKSLNRIASLIQDPFKNLSDDEEPPVPDDLPVSTYVIATHIYL